MKQHLAKSLWAERFPSSRGSSWATNCSTTSPEAVGIVLKCGFIAPWITLQGVRTDDNTAERCSGPRIACLQGIMSIHLDAFNWVASILVGKETTPSKTIL